VFFTVAELLVKNKKMLHKYKLKRCKRDVVAWDRDFWFLVQDKIET